MGIEITPLVARINGRPVLQPTCNRVPSLDRRNSLKKLSTPPPPPPPLPLPTSSSTSTSPRISTKASLTTPPISPKSKSPRPPAIKRSGNDPNGLNSSSEKVVTPGGTTRTKVLERKKSKSFKLGAGAGAGADAAHDHGRLSSTSIEASLIYSSSLITEAPGSIAAGRREQMALQHAQRKMRIAHYGRSKSANFERVAPIDTMEAKAGEEDHKRCSFITANSGMEIYVT